MALQPTIDRINDAIAALGQTKDLLLRGNADRPNSHKKFPRYARDISPLADELVRSRLDWLEARLAHRKAFLAETKLGEDGASWSLDTYNATADAERVAYFAYEHAVRAFDAAVGCVD